MQLLMTDGWKSARLLYPTFATTLARMVAKGWVEERKQQEIEYRITDAGRQAFRQKLPEGRPRTSAQ
jgi:DNA-binding PadR family transcriptional regulator